MKITVTEKKIKDMCGSLSYKRGDSFYRADKVILDSLQENRCEARVLGAEEFHVLIDQDGNGDLHTSCSCPKLASVKNDCQHIAAVLIALMREIKTGGASSEGLLSLFDHQEKRVSRHQLHFENRQILEIGFTCKPVQTPHGYLLGIEMTVNQTGVENIRDFLMHIKAGSLSRMSKGFNYDPALHCFQHETDAVIQRLIQVVMDEQIYEQSKALGADMGQLLIPPSSWEDLLQLLVNAPMVKLAISDIVFDGVHVIESRLPLQFEIKKEESHAYQLKVQGFERLLMLDLYQSVVLDGQVIKLNKEDNKRLAEIQQLLDQSDANHISIPTEQIHAFLNKVVPGLRRLGEVNLAKEMTSKLVNPRLVAKLYLDRVNNRLLAGLEFHYENIVIHPLEEREIPGTSTFVRDVDKEDAILELMETGSFAKTEGGYFLHNEELEYEFLHHILPKLQRLVQVYATTAVKIRVVRDANHPRISVKMKRERTNWLEFKFEMDGIPEKHIKEVLAALEEKRKYYRLPNGSLLSLETKEFAEVNRFLHALPDQHQNLESGVELPIIQGLRLINHDEDTETFQIEESFRRFLAEIYDPSQLDFKVPVQLEEILRDYQTQGFKWMKVLASYGFGGILADDMGLGKTLQSIAFIVSNLEDIRKHQQPVLIVCPSSLTYNWLNEIAKFVPGLQAIIIDGPQKMRVKIQKDAMKMDVVICSYPLLRKDSKWYEKQAFHTVFFDEAQSFKNPLTQTAKAVKKIQANHRFALTGTPVENSIEELWSIFHVVLPELFQGLKEYSHLSRKTIARRTRPFLLRRLKKDVLPELPEKVETMDVSDLLPDQKKLYAAYLAKLKHDTLKHLDKNTLRKNKIKILAGLTRLRQICCHPALFVDGYKGSSAKFEQLKQIIEEARASGRRVLIFSQFTSMLAIIGRDLTLKGLPFFYLDGQTPSDERIEMTNRFNEGERNLFLISLKAGGTGLNLTGADTVILYDLWWNPAVEEQAADRAYRIGQTNNVQVIKLIARGTIEEKINELQTKKKHLIEEMIQSDERVVSSLTEEDIREILMI